MNNIDQEDENLRKGPWTEHEDVQLVFYVNMFGDRRWDFIAKVSGLKRTGKSCRLRWVNYLHPGLKRGRMTPQEEKLVLEYHSKWGNRWSRIARKLPGRTDNEIKNYWRTHMRKKAQEHKKCISPSTSFSNSSSTSSTCTNDPTVDSMPMDETKERSFYDTGGIELVSCAISKSNNNNNTMTKHNKVNNEEQEGIYSMDEIWKDLDLLENEGIKPVFDRYSNGVSPQVWDYSLNSFWMMDGGQQEFSTNMFFPATSELLTG
ncbi:transcription factor MYB48-like [Rutidosis leptorrhynchoides]|uniref:transcription factor MYB48-like n=1 Tax=Rutidosis leptorrhynchoides TaxID=125765 RepID=UPI003A99FACE